MKLSSRERARLVDSMAAALPNTNGLKTFVASVNQSAWEVHVPQNATHRDAAGAIVTAAAGGGWSRELVGALTKQFPAVPAFGELLKVVESPPHEKPNGGEGIAKSTWALLAVAVCLVLALGGWLVFGPKAGAITESSVQPTASPSPTVVQTTIIQKSGDHGVGIVGDHNSVTTGATNSTGSTDK